MNVPVFGNFLTALVRPGFPDEDLARRAFILNVVLLACLALFGLCLLKSSYDSLVGNDNALPTFVLFIICAALTSLYLLSHKGRVMLASVLLLGMLFALATYMAAIWGFDVPAAALLYVLVITMAGVLLGTRAAFATTVVTGFTLAAVGVLQVHGAFIVDTLWKRTPASYTDIIVTGVIFAVIATVAWLSNREIQKSLARVRESEAALKRERDLLEVRVEERTQELRRAELERMAQAYRFVEFGRLAGGVFHDLASPLTAVSLYMERVASMADQQSIASVRDDVARVQKAAAQMRNLLGSLRRHLEQGGKREEWFSLDELLGQAVQLLEAYARKRGVTLSYAGAPVRRYGDPVAFAQAVTNLLSNAIESFGEGADDTRRVTTSLEERKGNAVLRVADTGPGMPSDVLERIFEPFFSTKGAEGLGIGLPLARRIFEKSFGGWVSFESAPGKGTTFTIYLPYREP